MISEATKADFVRGEAEAVREVYNACLALVYGVALKVLGNHYLAEEATQETFERAWKAAQRFDVDRELEPWLAVIAWRVALDVFRREVRRRHETLNDAESAANRLVDDSLEFETFIEQCWRTEVVHRALEALQPDERNVVYLQFYRGLTHGEIAERLGIPLGTVKSRSDRARRHLSDSLQDVDLLETIEIRRIESPAPPPPRAKMPVERATVFTIPESARPLVLDDLDEWLPTLRCLARAEAQPPT